ncbi:MAG: hypothetical protein AB1813_04695 [Verrucomicrobiota bacterium]
MTLLPVIRRELNEEARRPMNYWVRVLAGSALVIMFGLVMIRHWMEGRMQSGGPLFATLNATIFLTIWIIVPMMVADCISREKREGTLGLLFLTPLNAFEIVIGKVISHGLRALVLMLSFLPVLAMPLILGGVSWRDLVLALGFDFSSLLLALAAGLAASSFSRDWIKAYLLALLFSLGLRYLFLVLIYLGFWWGVSASGGRPVFWGMGGPQLLDVMWANLWNMNVQDRTTMLFGLSTGVLTSDYGFFGSGRGQATSTWNAIAVGFPKATLNFLLKLAVFAIPFSFLLMTLALAVAAWRVRRCWRDAPASKEKRWLLQAFCTPRFWRARLQRSMHRNLNRNPIGWLQRYSWSARLTQWGWCLGIIIVECMLVMDPNLSNLWSGQFFIGWLLLLSMAFTASASFRRERESGALELLLVSPLRVGQIIRGRLRGIWGQFLPATMVFLLAWLILFRNVSLFSFDWYQPGHDQHWLKKFFMALFASSYLLLPVVGLRASMARLNAIMAWLATGFFTLALPFVLSAIAQFSFFSPGDLENLASKIFWRALFFQWLLAAIFYWGLQRALIRRSFALSH